MFFLLIEWLSFGERGTLKFDNQGQGGGKTLNVYEQGGLGWRGGRENWLIFMDATCVSSLSAVMGTCINLKSRSKSSKKHVTH